MSTRDKQIHCAYANTGSVKAYLEAAFICEGKDIDAILAGESGEIEHARIMRSFAYYPGGRIADRAGLAPNPAFDPDTEDEDEEDDD